MAGIDTKQKILNAAVRLFNENGMSNVRLQQIASSIGISPGNLAYHFKNKEAIAHAIQDDLQEQVSKVLSAYRMFPNMMDFDNQLNVYYSFISSHPFYFMDALEIDRNYPVLHEQRLANASKMVSQIRKRFDYNRKRGLVLAERHNGLYDEVANTIWMIIGFWSHKDVVLDDHEEAGLLSFKKVIWNQIYPFFTKKGIQEYESLIVPILHPHIG